jgi:hypothetical protein
LRRPAKQAEGAPHAERRRHDGGVDVGDEQLQRRVLVRSSAQGTGDGGRRSVSDGNSPKQSL